MPDQETIATAIYAVTIAGLIYKAVRPWIFGEPPAFGKDWL